MSKKLPILATGRRKSATAQVELKEGSGRFYINGKWIETTTKAFPYFSLIQEPLALLKSPEGLSSIQTLNELESVVDSSVGERVDIFIKVQGGGSVSQAQAIKLGISRACGELNIGFRILLRKHGFLTTDSRCKERKKYGLKKARKAPQFSKR